MANGTENSIRTSLYIPPELLAQVRAEAELSGRSLNGQLLAMVRAGLTTPSDNPPSAISLSELRDRMAIAALSGMMSCTSIHAVDPEFIASAVWDVADAMLASREIGDAILAARGAHDA